MQDQQFDPVRGERLIRSLRIENRQLKSRLRAVERLSAQELPANWHKELSDIRKENARFRVERNALRAEVAQLRAELEAGRSAK